MNRIEGSHGGAVEFRLGRAMRDMRDPEGLTQGRDMLHRDGQRENAKGKMGTR